MKMPLSLILLAAFVSFAPNASAEREVTKAHNCRCIVNGHFLAAVESCKANLDRPARACVDLARKTYEERVLECDKLQGMDELSDMCI